MNQSTVSNILQALELADLDADWVERIHGSEFTEDPDIDIEIPTNAHKLLENCNEILRNSSQNVDQGGITSSALFNELSQQGISGKTVQSWIYYIFHSGLKISADFESKQLCLLAADFYFLLLKLPGMSRSELHHAILFEKAVNALSMATTVDIDNSKEQKGRKRKANLPLSQSQKRRKHGNETTQGQDNSDEESAEITPKQAAVLYRQLTCVLRDFCKYLAVISLRSNEVSLKHAVQTLTKMANWMRGSCPSRAVIFTEYTSEGSTADSLELPFQLCIYGLFLIVSKKHGELDQLCLLLFRFLVPILIMKDANAPSSSVPRAFMQNSDLFRQFICHLFDVHGDSVAHSISVLTQNIIAQCPDRTEFRQHMADVVSCILHHMPLSWYASFCDWLKRMSVHAKIVYRSNTVAVIGKLLCLPERCSSGDADVDPNSLMQMKHGYMLQIALERLTDAAPSVRSRALVVIINMMEEGIVSPSALMLAMDSKQGECHPSGLVTAESTPISTACSSRKTNTPPTLHSVAAPGVTVTGTPQSDVSNRSSLLHSLTKCSQEPKAMVRKTAVQAMEMALKCGFLQPSEEGMSILETKCRDPSLIVRKQAVGSISEVLLTHKDSRQAQESWARGVLPAILDAESSVQEKSAALIESIILDNMGESDEKSKLAWDLISFFASKPGESLRTYLQIACGQWNRQRKLDGSIVKKVVAKLDDDCLCGGAWLFLRFLTLYICPPVVTGKIVTVWMEEHKKRHSLPFHVNSITTIGQIAGRIDAESRQTVLDVCTQRLKMPQCPIQLISCLVETICNLIEAAHKDKEGSPEWPQPLMQWCQKTLAECDRFLYDVIINHSRSNTFQCEQALIHCLYVAGNVGRHCATKAPKRLLLSLQALLTSTDIHDTTSHTSIAASQQVPEDREMSASQDIPASQPLSQFQQGGGVPQHIRAHAVMNLGKICLHHKQLAKKCVPAMVRELDVSDSDMVRNNVLIILTDLCFLQTQLVDPYLSDMANCLGDKSVTVRRNALILLNSLLKKDYVKWRGSLIFKFLSMLCDPSPEIQNLVRYSLIEQTLRRNAGDICFRHFVESIFYFNAFVDHSVFNRFSKSERELKLFDFSGDDKISDRMLIYTFMLEQMDDEHRIKLTGKLCCDILDAFVDGVIPLSRKSNSVLADTLAVLCSQKLKLKCMKPVSEEDQEMEGMQSEPAAARNAMKQKIISHVVKRNLIENIIPIIIALKNVLVSNKSPLLRNVMLCLKEIIKDYKTEVQDILTGDKQLASEIEFDLKRFDREQEERMQLELQTPAPSAPGTPQFPVPPPSADPERPKTPRPSTPVRPAQSAVPGSPGICQTPTLQKENQHRREPLSSVPFATPGSAVRGPRRRGLGIAAVLNSARKTLGQLKISEKDSEKPRSDAVARRAISTPVGKTGLSDLTFSNLTEISVILTPLPTEENK